MCFDYNILVWDFRRGATQWLGETGLSGCKGEKPYDRTLALVLNLCGMTMAALKTSEHAIGS